MLLLTHTECNELPEDHSEIPSRDAAKHQCSRSIAHKIPLFYPEAHILILLGRNILQLHKKQRNGPHDSPLCLKAGSWMCYNRFLFGSCPQANKSHCIHLIVLHAPTRSMLRKISPFQLVNMLPLTVSF